MFNTDTDADADFDSDTNTETDAYNADSLWSLGLIVTYDIRKQPGHRIISLHKGQPDKKDQW